MTPTGGIWQSQLFSRDYRRTPPRKRTPSPGQRQLASREDAAACLQYAPDRLIAHNESADSDRLCRIGGV